MSSKYFACNVIAIGSTYLFNISSCEPPEEVNPSIALYSGGATLDSKDELVTSWSNSTLG